MCISPQDEHNHCMYTVYIQLKEGKFYPANKKEKSEKNKSYHIPWR